MDASKDDDTIICVRNRMSVYFSLPSADEPQTRELLKKYSSYNLEVCINTCNIRDLLVYLKTGHHI